MKVEIDGVLYTPSQITDKRITIDGVVYAELAGQGELVVVTSRFLRDIDNDVWEYRESTGKYRCITESNLREKSYEDIRAMYGLTAEGPTRESVTYN